MNEEPKNVPKKSRWESWWRGWLIVIVATALILFVVTRFIPGQPQGLKDWAQFFFALFVASAVVGTVFTLIWAFFVWLFCWRNFKRLLFGFACLATLMALLYVEENWRAKQDWEQFKSKWEAKGVSFDRQSVIPPAVPDDENFAFSPVWIAQEKDIFQNTPKRAEEWYGDRIYSAEVEKMLQLLPISDNAVTGTNLPKEIPDTPVFSGSWPTAHETDLKPWQAYYRNLETTNPAVDISITPQPQSPAADVLLALSKYDPVFDRLQQDSRLPYSRFPIQYDTEKPMEILLPHLAGIKRCVFVLRLRAIAELQNNQSEQALEDIKLMFRLADSVRTEPFLISHLVRIAIFEIALQPIYEGLANHEWSDAQLAELESSLAEFDFLDDYKTVAHGEMVYLCEDFFDYLRHHPSEINNLLIDPNNDRGVPVSAQVICYLIPGSFGYQNELHCARAIMEYFVPLADTSRQIMSPSAVRRSSAALETETRNFNPYHSMERVLLPILPETPEKFAYAQTSANLALVAVALERYRLAKGQFPESLDALAPQFIPSVPHDVIDGEPLHYRRTPDGQFVLYSVGWDETDDGGVVNLKQGSTGQVDRDQGDWVWRYPEK